MSSSEKVQTTEEQKPEKEEQKVEKVEKPYSQKTFIERFFTPGTEEGTLVFIRFTLIVLICFLLTTAYLSYNIHFIIMTGIAVCLYFSFNFYVSQLKKYDLLNPEETKEKREKAEKAKAAREAKEKKEKVE